MNEETRRFLYEEEDYDIGVSAGVSEDKETN